MEAPKYIEVWRLRSKRERKRGQRSLAVESGAAQARAREEMRYRFQGLRILFGRVNNCQPRASSVMLIRLRRGFARRLGLTSGAAFNRVRSRVRAEFLPRDCTTPDF